MLTVSQAKARFTHVAAQVEPVAERECRARTAPGTNCDFKIRIEPRVDAPVNAYQTLDKTGRPVITFTVALISQAQNSTEIAFVLGHEAAHHIAGHMSSQQRNTILGAVVFAGLAAATGGSAGDVQTAQDLGAMIGSRAYSKEFELEADALGTVITYRAGYDPLVGARFFTRLPDPGDRFLGTHPPNAARMNTVEATMARIRG